MKLIDFITTGPCEVSRTKFDAAVANLNSLRDRVTFLEMKEIRAKERMDVQLERQESSEMKRINLHGSVTRLELNVQAAIRDICQLIEERDRRMDELEKRIMRLERPSRPEDGTDETDL